MVERFNEKANTLAHEYWRLKGVTAEKAGGKRLKEIEKLLEKGIGGKLKEQLDVEAKRLRKEEEDRSSAFAKLTEVEKDLLELTADLAPNLDLGEEDFFPYDKEYEPLSEKYFSALTNIFFGTPSPSIQFKVATLADDGIKVNLTDESSALEILGYVIMIIQEMAKKRLGVTNTIDAYCLLLKRNPYALFVLGTLLKEGRKMGITEIKEVSHRADKEHKELVGDTLYDKELVNGVAYLVSDEWEYNLVKEINDKYDATDFGAMVWRVYNADANKEEEQMKGTGIAESSLHLQRILKFLKK